MSSRTPPVAVELKPSALYGGLLVVLVLSAAGAALASHHPLWLKSLLLAGIAGLLYRAWRDECTRGACRLELSPTGRVTVTIREGAVRREGTVRRDSAARNGSVLSGQCTGHAVLGTLAVFVFVDTQGGQSGSNERWSRMNRWPFRRHARIAVLCDATDPDDFRRLRARLRLRPAEG